MCYLLRGLLLSAGINSDGCNDKRKQAKQEQTRVNCRRFIKKSGDSQKFFKHLCI